MKDFERNKGIGHDEKGQKEGKKVEVCIEY